MSEIMPKISVIIPIYGVEKYIERCARSLFEQTLDDIEYIFIDDCSPDASIKILECIIEKYRIRISEKNYSVKIERLPSNRGLPAVRMHGNIMASGDYIIHCDSDDWVEREWAETLYRKAIKDNLDVVICDYFRVINGHKEECKNKCFDHRSKDYYIGNLLTKKCITAVWNKLVKRSIYQRDDFQYPKFNMWEDYYISIQIFYYSKRIGYANVPLYNYYYNNQSICYNDHSQERIKQVVLNCNSILTFLKHHNLESRFSSEIIVLKNNAKNEALSSFRSSEFYQMWKNIYPENNMKYLFSRIVSLKDKIRFITVWLGLYPTWLKITNRAQK